MPKVVRNLSGCETLRIDDAIDYLPTHKEGRGARTDIWLKRAATAAAFGIFDETNESRNSPR